MDAETAATKLSEDMNRITTWCCSNSLLVNPGKTKLLLMGTKQMLERLPENFHITVFDKEIRPVLNAEDLGMLLDSRLSYDEQITSVVSTCIAGLCQINRIKHILDKRTLTHIINALIFSRMYYCSSVWSNTAKKNITKLQGVQNFAARIVTGTRKYDHVTPVLQRLGWLPVQDMLNFRDAVMTFKCIKGLAPPYLSEKFELRSELHNVNTRYKNDLNIPLYTSASGQRTFYFRAVTLWNNLPNNIKDINVLGSFKSEYKRILLDQFLDTIFRQRNFFFN